MKSRRSEKEVRLEKSKLTKFDHLSKVVLQFERKTYWQPHSKRCSHRTWHDASLHSWCNSLPNDHALVHIIISRNLGSFIFVIKLMWNYVIYGLSLLVQKGEFRWQSLDLSKEILEWPLMVEQYALCVWQIPIVVYCIVYFHEALTCSHCKY